MTRPASVKQPGPPQSPRVVEVAARGRSFEMVLEPGLLLLEAVRRGFAAQGFASGVIDLGAVKLGSLAYVMPALSKDGKNAAFYSETYRPAGVTRLDCGAMTFGRRDGAPFFHCHALWREADGKRSGGHILPEETLVAERVTVAALGLEGAMFEAEPDPETNFKIFGPKPVADAVARSQTRVVALRLRPNQDFLTTLEDVARRHGMRRARMRGGVGSTIGAALQDGTIVENFATEVFVRHGMIAADATGVLEASAVVGLVDYKTEIAEGQLLRGENPVLMTFELVLEELSE